MMAIKWKPIINIQKRISILSGFKKERRECKDHVGSGNENKKKDKEIHELDGPATSSSAGWGSGSSSSGTPMGAFG
jgi:hypothetical protein